MKSYIVLAASFLLLMFFPLQYAVNVVNNYHMSTVDKLVHNAAQQARTEGRFTPQMIDGLKADIAAKLHLSADEVVVNATTTPKYRLNRFDEREMIHYEVRVPIKKIVAMNAFFGIPDADNRSEYMVAGSVPSEVLLP